MRRFAALLVFMLTTCSMLVPSTVAQAAPKTATVKLGAEAWYSSPQLCVLSALCLPLASPVARTYPAGTLHIGAAAGAESARTYLALRKPLAKATLVKTGTLRLPLDTNPVDGSVTPDLAKVKACTTTAKIKRVSGATTAPPKVNCAHAPLSQIIGIPATELDINLKPIAARLSKKGTSLALLPVLTTGATWDVTVSSDQRANSSATRPVLILTSATRSATKKITKTTHAHHHAASTSQGSGSSIGDDGDSAPVEIPSGPVDTGTQTTQGSGDTGSQPQIVPKQTPAALRLAVGPHSFDYPVVFLLPLLILAGLIGFGRQLTRPLTSAGDRTDED